MYRYNVSSGGRTVGRAEVEKEGLYWLVRVSCEPVSEAFLRVSAENINKHLPLGILIPQSGTLTLERRIARSRFCFYPDTVLTLDESPRWEDFSGEAAGWMLPGARACHKDGGWLICVPAMREKPFACMPLFCFFRLIMRQEKQYWLLELDGEMNPLMPEKLPES